MIQVLSSAIALTRSYRSFRLRELQIGGCALKRLYILNRRKFFGLFAGVAAAVTYVRCGLQNDDDLSIFGNMLSAYGPYGGRNYGPYGPYGGRNYRTYGPYGPYNYGPYNYRTYGGGRKLGSTLKANEKSQGGLSLELFESLTDA